MILSIWMESVALPPKRAESRPVKDVPEKISKERKGGVIAIYHNLRSGDKKRSKLVAYLFMR